MRAVNSLRDLLATHESLSTIAQGVRHDLYVRHFNKFIRTKLAEQAKVRRRCRCCCHFAPDAALSGPPCHVHQCAGSR
jgi:hypothetical protein